jgi:xylulokinase
VGEPWGSPTLVGIDVGTTGVKALALSADGDVLAVASRGYALSTPQPGWAEQDPEVWWIAAESALDEVTAGREVAGIGLSGQMHGLVVLDAAGRVIRPAILWNDQRTAAECREIEERVGLERLIGRTGNRALTGFTAPKLLWLRRHEPEAYTRIARVLLPKDYVRLRLTGEWAIDASDASGTLLLDVERRTWSDEVLEALELPADWLPPVFESPERAGARNDQAQGTPVAVGAGDQPAAAIGVGVDRPGPVSVVLGTSGVVLAALPAYAHDRAARVHAFCHAVPGSWQAMGVMLSAAGSLEWFRERLAADASFAALVDEAERWQPGAEGLHFLPYLAGERTPHADPNARGAFVGLQLRHDRGALVRAILEGVAFGLRDSLDLLRELGAEATVGRVSGGGARSPLWLRIVASVLELRLETTESEQGSAFGAALLGGVAGGVYADVHEAVTRCVRAREAIEPDPQWVSRYAELHARHQALYPALHPVRVAP